MAASTGQTEDRAKDVLTISVKDQQQNAVQFKIKMGTKLGKVFAAYHQKKGVQDGTFKFAFEGHRLVESATPETMGMEDGDVIDAMTEQLGGAHASALLCHGQRHALCSLPASSVI